MKKFKDLIKLLIILNSTSNCVSFRVATHSRYFRHFCILIFLNVLEYLKDYLFNNLIVLVLL